MPLLRSAVDRQFLRFCRTGDPQALGDVFDRTAAELLRVACYLSRNRADAEDLVQRTFLAAIESRATFTPKARALPWLLGILANHARRLQRERRQPPTVAEPVATDPAVVAAQHELDERLARLRAEMGAPYSEVLQLHLEQGLSAKEIAVRLSRPAGTVRTQLVRALAQLRARLPEGFVGALLPFGGAAGGAGGLSAMRRVVMHAVDAPTTVLVVGSGVPVFAFWSWCVSNKVAVVVPLIAALVGIGGFLLFSDRDAAPSATPGAAMTAEHSTLEPHVTASTDRTKVAGVMRSEPTATVVAGMATARVVVRWHDGGLPAPGVGVFASNGRDVARRDAVTDADGCAELPGLVPGEWTIDAVLSQLPHTCTLHAGDTTTIELEALRLATAAGTVVDADGRAVGDARIWMSVEGDWSHGHEVTRSDAAGHFTVPLLNMHYLGARKSGYAPSHTLVAWPGRGDVAALVLRLQRAGGEVRGIVQDRTSAPIPFAKVLLGDQHMRVLDGDAHDRREQLPRGIEVTTGPDGRFAASGVPAGLCELRAWALGYAPCVAGIEVLPSGCAESVLVLSPGAAVRGTVHDTGGASLAGVAVRWGSDREFCHRVAVSAADGSFLLDDLAPGSQELAAERDASRAKTRLQLDAGVVATWDPVLGTSQGLHGRLLDEHGGGLADFTVAARRQYERLGEVTTDAAGEFALTQVGAEAVTLEVSQQGQVLTTVADVVPGAAVVITLTPRELPSAFLSGRLVDERGEPVTGELLPWRHGVDGARGYPTGSDGRFRIGPLRAGHYRLNVQAERFARRELIAMELAVDESRDLGDFVLTAPGAAKFTVTMFGRPATGGYVYLRQPEGDWNDSAAIEQGIAKHAALPPGRLFVTAEFQGLTQSAEITVVAGVTVEAALDLQRTHRATIAMTGRDDWTAAERDAVLVAHRPDGTFAGSFGVVQLPGPPTFFCDLPIGRYELSLRLADGRTGKTAVDLTAGSTQGAIEIAAAAK